MDLQLFLVQKISKQKNALNVSHKNNIFDVDAKLPLSLFQWLYHYRWNTLHHHSKFRAGAYPRKMVEYMGMKKANKLSPSTQKSMRLSVFPYFPFQAGKWAYHPSQEAEVTEIKKVEKFFPLERFPTFSFQNLKVEVFLLEPPVYVNLKFQQEIVAESAQLNNSIYLFHHWRDKIHHPFSKTIHFHRLQQSNMELEMSYSMIFIPINVHNV